MNESESLTYIEEKFGRKVSRRTFYCYKKKNQQQLAYNYNYYFGSGVKKNKNSKTIERYYLLAQKKKMLNTVFRGYQSIATNDRPKEIPFYFKKSLTLISNPVHDIKKLFARMERINELTDERRKEIPNNATIRKEYVECRKDSCRACKHGPYLYAYWRDEQSKLRKKYIGITHVGDAHI